MEHSLSTQFAATRVITCHRPIVPKPHPTIHPPRPTVEQFASQFTSQYCINRYLAEVDHHRAFLAGRPRIIDPGDQAAGRDPLEKELKAMLQGEKQDGKVVRIMDSWTTCL